MASKNIKYINQWHLSDIAILKKEKIKILKRKKKISYGTSRNHRVFHVTPDEPYDIERIILLYRLLSL